jgi:DNA ligase-1
MDLQDGGTAEMQGSGSKPYIIKNVGGVYSCNCMAWRNQSNPAEKRTCKHIRKLRGDDAEEKRIGSITAPMPIPSTKNVPPLLLAEKWDGILNPTGWWMSEKLDGVRAYWTGKEFLSRQGNVYHAPDWFIANLPDTPLDGELWTGRKLFQQTVSIVRRQDKNAEWKKVAFLAFDAPDMDAKFESRLMAISKMLKSEYAKIHMHSQCKSVDHLRNYLKEIESYKGEGVMLRQPESMYVAGRSSTLLKVKTFHDMEAKVIGHEKGLGKHKNRLGALQVELTNGIKFSVGTGFSDAEREDPPKIGSIITFRYQELSNDGVPRFPSYIREYN